MTETDLELGDWYRVSTHCVLKKDPKDRPVPEGHAIVANQQLHVRARNFAEAENKAGIWMEEHHPPSGKDNVRRKYVASIKRSRETYLP